MNTQEKEPELGEGVTSAEYWMYDGKLGRRWNMDPIYKFYESPYSCFGNNPNIYIDINGMDTIDVYSQSVDANGKMEGEKGYDKNSMLKFVDVGCLKSPDFSADIFVKLKPIIFIIGK